MGQVDHDLAELVDGQLAALEGVIELDLEQVGLVQRCQDADGHQAPIAQLERRRRSRRCRRGGRPSCRCSDPGGVGVYREAVDLFHLGDAGRVVIWLAH